MLSLTSFLWSGACASCHITLTQGASSLQSLRRWPNTLSLSLSKHFARMPHPCLNPALPLPPSLPHHCLTIVWLLPYACCAVTNAAVPSYKLPRAHCLTAFKSHSITAGLYHNASLHAPYSRGGPLLTAPADSPSASSATGTHYLTGLCTCICYPV